MPVDQSWLWGDSQYSDVTLLIHPAGDGPDGAGGADKPEPRKLPLHTLILASASPRYFRSRTHGAWSCEAESPPEPAAIITREALAVKLLQLTLETQSTEPVAIMKRQAHAAVRVLELTCFPGEPQEVPEAVLRHPYTGQLPAGDISTLARMLWRADYLDMHGTVTACLSEILNLLAASKPTVQDLVVLGSLPALQTDGSTAAVEQALTSMADKVLPTQLRSASQVLLDEQLLGQFVQLPFALLKRWAKMASLEVGSENTMAVIMTAWYDHQVDSGTAPTEQQCKELSTLLCLDKVSLSFHLQAIPHLKWYRAPASLPAQHAVARVLDAASYQAGLTSGGTTRQLPPLAEVSRQWPLSRQQLETLWSTRALRLDKDIYLAGFCYRVELRLRPAEPQAGQTDQQPQQPAPYNIGLYLFACWPPALIRHAVADKAPSLIASLRGEVKVGKAVPITTDLLSVSSEGRGWSNVGKRGFTRVEELVSFMEVQPCVSIKLSDEV